MFPIFEEIKSRKKYIYYLLFFLCGLIFLQLMGRAIRSGDDPAFAVWSTTLGSMWNAALVEAAREGRFFYTMVIYVTQIPYQFEGFLVLNLVTIISNVLVFVLCFRLVKTLWGETFALIATFTCLALFDFVGGHTNLFNTYPSCCLVGFMLVLQSLTLFCRRIQEGQNSFWLPAFLFYFSLHFYEIFICYILAYPLIYFGYHPLNKDRLKNFIKSFRPFLILLAIYLICYALYRHFHPPYYAGIKDLDLSRLDKAWYTLYVFSFSGVFFEWPILESNFMLIGFLMTALFTAGFWLAIKKTDPANAEAVLTRRLLYSFLAVFPFIFGPNVLYSVSKFKHSIAEKLGYYVGAYFSSFAVFIEVAILFSLLLIFFKNIYLKRALKTAFVLILSLVALGNYNYSQKAFYFDRVDAHKWGLLDDMLELAKDSLVDTDVICTVSFFEDDSSMRHYDYWSFYATKKSDKRIKMFFADPKTESRCTWAADYETAPYRSQLVFQHLKSKKIFKTSTDLPKPPLNF